MKLYRLQKKSKVDITTLTSYMFKPHTITLCTVCEPAKAGRKKVARSESNSSIAQVAERYGFESYKVNGQEWFMYKEMMGAKFIVTKSVSVEENGIWTIFLFQKEIKKEAAFYRCLPDIMDFTTADEIFSVLESFKICIGNNDFPNLMAQKILNSPEHFQSPSNCDVGLIQTNTLQSWDDFSVVRHVDCALLVKEDSMRCESCTTYRKLLHAMVSRRHSEESQDVSKDTTKTNDRYLSKVDLLGKLKSLENEKKMLTQRNARLQNRIKQLVHKDGIRVDSCTNELMKTIQDEQQQCPFETNSPQALLWEQQKLQANLKESRAMVWHPLIIRWCLSIYLKSPGTYKHIRNSPFLSLPCKNTLLKYVNFTDPGCGFNPDIISRLIESIDFDNISERERNVSLLFDEMKIKSGLVFCPTTGKLVGLCEMGAINDALAEFARKCESGDSTDSGDHTLAQYVIVFMVRGIFSSLCKALGHYVSQGFTSDQLYPCTWEAVRILESIGLKVRAVVADGASPNRKFFRIHKAEDNAEGRVVYWTWNKWAPERKVYFICDVPHLIKTTRNNLENSHWNKKTRNLMYQGQEMGWHQIVSLYEWDLGPMRNALGLRFQPKLKDEHINLSPQSRMRVNLAAQVLSFTVFKMLEEQNFHTTMSLRKFVLFMDKFFDCLNVTTTKNKKGKTALEPYRSKNDPRFEWLKNDFIGFINEWEDEAIAQGHLSKKEQNKLCLSKQTLEGLRITVHSFVELAKLLFDEEYPPFLLSEKFSQDPVEEHFSKHRRRGGANENPDVLEFSRNALGLDLAGDAMIRVMTGNTRGRERDDVRLTVDNTALPRKKVKKNE